MFFICGKFIIFTYNLKLNRMPNHVTNFLTIGAEGIF